MANGGPVPVPTGADLDAVRVFWAIYEPNADDVQARLLEAAKEIPDFAPLLRAMTPERLAEDSRLGIEAQRKGIFDGDWTEHLTRSREQGIAYAHAGIGFSAWLALTSSYRAVIAELLRREIPGDPERLAEARRGMDAIVDLGLAVIGESYLAAKQAVIEKQKAAIRELSTPVLQLRDRMLVLPVIGVVDTARARSLTEDLLRAIRDRRARVVVMDVTGVPIVDSKVASHLVQTVDAARLMGAQVIVTGISPEIAQTMVTIGANFGDVPTLGDLQSGFEAAQEILRAADGPIVLER